MSILSKVTSWVFSKELSKLLKEAEKSYGSQFYERLLANVRNQPVYMPDKIESYINDGYLFNPSVYSIVSFIAQKAGAIPWGVYEVKNDKALQLYKSASQDLPYYKKAGIKTKALVQLPDHELNQLFVTPNILQGWADFFEQVVGFKLVTGNSYIHAIGPENGANAGKIKEFWSLPSQIITIVAGDKAHPVKQYEMVGDRLTVLKPEQVIHLKYWTPNYASGQFLYGVSPIQAGRRVVTKNNASFDSMVASFQNMGANGIISGDSSNPEQALTEEQAEMIEQRYKRKYSGPKNAGKPIITSAALKWQQMGMSPVDLNIIESDKMDIRTICNLYHVPSELFNDASNKTYSNTNEAGSAVYTNAVIPALTQFRDAINQYIRGKYEDKIYIDFDTSLISELQDDLQMMTTALQGCWWLTPNEKRDIMSFSADETNPLMDEYLIPSTLKTLSTINDTPEPNDIALEEERKY
jgi:HK97 family phage portal protein